MPVQTSTVSPQRNSRRANDKNAIEKRVTHSCFCYRRNPLMSPYCPWAPPQSKMPIHQLSASENMGSLSPLSHGN